MRIFPPELEIGDREGFDPKKDIFQRAEFGMGIANLLSKSSDPLIVVLDAPWGMGKTTFIRMLSGHLRNENFPVIYFDAFKNDHVDNGFLAIAGEIIRTSKELNPDESLKHKAFVKAAARAGGILLRMGAKVGVKAATLGAIDAADFEGLKSVADDVAKEASTKADEYVESLLKLQSQEHETIENVRRTLSELAGSLPETEGESEDARKPVVFIIDELDRCKPTFALELLEKIKHVFSIPNIHFILATHLSQLESTVRFSYGSDVDAGTYLQKFYNIILHFPEPSPYRQERHIPKYVKYLSQTLSLNSDDMGFVQSVADAKQFSLRTMERIATTIALARSFTPENYLWLHPIVAGLAVMKITNPHLFRRALSGDLELDEVRTAFAVDSWPPDEANNAWMMEWWTYCLAKKEADFPELDWKGFQQSLFRYSIRDRKNIVHFMAGHIHRLQLPEGK
jgi:GTPase SAR1 family protein